MPDIADVAWSERDDRNSEAVPEGWPQGTMPAYVDQTGRMMMGATKRFWNKINPVYQTSGTGDTYVVQTEVGVDQINLYELLCVRIDRSNVGTTPTLQFGSTNPRTVVKAGPSGYVPLAAGDMYAGNSHTFWYNGAVYVLTNPAIIIGGTVQPFSPNLTSWAAVTRAAGFDTWAASGLSADLAALVTDETGTGALVFANTPILTTPFIGTASGTNLTLSALTASSALATNGSKTLVSVANTGSGNNVLATSPTLVTPILGAAAGTSLSLSGLTASSAVATDASKNLVSVTNTGSGNNVLATSPTLVTPSLGTPSALVLTNATGLPIAGGGTNASDVGTARLNFTLPLYVANLTALKAVDTTKDIVAIRKDLLGAGRYVWTTGNLSTQVTADTTGAIYVKANAIATTVGAWVLQDGGWAVQGVDARWCGVVADGSTDNTTALQAASDLAIAIGVPIVRLPSGQTVRVTNGLTISSAVRWVGMGPAKCTIETTSSTGDVLTVSVTTGNDGFIAEGIAWTTSVTRSAGYFINLNGSYYTRIRHCTFVGGFNGVGITGAASQSEDITDCIFANQSNWMIAILANTAGNGTGPIVLRDLWMHGTSVGTQAAAAIYVESAGELTLDHVSAIWCGNSLIVAPPNGERVQALFCINCFFDSGSGFGVYVAPVGTGVVHLLKMVSVWAASNASGGIVLAASTGLVKQVELTSCTISGNGTASGNGLLVNSGTTKLTVLGGSYSQNFSSGIAFASGAGDFKVIGATCGPSGEFGGNGSYGIYVDPGIGDNFEIVGNDLRGNTTAAILMTVPTSPTKVVHSNIGAAVSRLIPDAHIASVKGTKTALTNSITTAQAIFVAANDALTVLGGTTYRFRTKIPLNTGATSHTTAFGLGGTATFTSISYTALATSVAVGTAATPQMTSVETAAATVLTAASVATRTDILVEGEFEVNAAGTIIPQVTFSAGPTGTCEVALDSFFECWGVGPNSVNFAGQWS